MSTTERNGGQRERAAKIRPLNYWSTDPRWYGITRPYRTDALRLRGSIQIEYTLARLARKL